MSVNAKSAGSVVVALIAGCALVFWWVWRGFLLAGGPYPAGPACKNQVMCQEGLCLVHARAAGDGKIVRTAGYCSQHCADDKGCPSDMACEAFPAGISRADGDHLPLVKLPEKLCIRRGVTPQ